MTKDVVINDKVIKKVTDDLEWKKVDHEEYRIYVFPGNERIQIDRPVLLNVSKSGGHRILDIENVSHYIPSGWIHLYWETDDDNAYWF